MPDDALRPDAAPASLYEADFQLWAEAQARALREGRARDLDWDHLAEEIETLGRSQRHELRNRLARLIQHLAKWAWQPEQRKYGWRVTIQNQRDAIARLMDLSPSLRGEPAEALAKSWRRGVLEAVLDTGLHERDFPAECPWSVEDVLRDGFYPGPPGGPD